MALRNDIVLGIDFGTSYSTAGALINGQVEWVLDRGDSMIPTVVHFPSKGPPIVGFEAAARMATHPGTTVQSIKRILGRDYDDREVRLLDAGVGYRLAAGPRNRVALQLGRETVACEQVAATVLSYLRDLAETRFGCRIGRAVIAVPAEASPAYVAALKRAARIAHLELLQVIPEPIAGALSLGMHGEVCDRRIAVCDFGGGTFDATLIEQRGQQFLPVACHGNSQLGGDDFDAILANEIADSVYRRCRYNLRNDVVKWQMLHMRCESAKRILSSEQEARLAMSDAYVENKELRNIDVLLDRKWVESKWQELLTQMNTVLDRLLKSSGWQASDCDEVVVIGGTSLIPAVRRGIAEFFERESITSNALANVAVAYGATLQTAAYIKAPNDVPRLVTSHAGA